MDRTCLHTGTRGHGNGRTLQRPVRFQSVASCMHPRTRAPTHVHMHFTCTCPHAPMRFDPPAPQPHRTVYVALTLMPEVLHFMTARQLHSAKQAADPGGARPCTYLVVQAWPCTYLVVQARSAIFVKAEPHSPLTRPSLMCCRGVDGRPAHISPVNPTVT